MTIYRLTEVNSLFQQCGQGDNIFRQGWKGEEIKSYVYEINHLCWYKIV